MRSLKIGTIIVCCVMVLTAASSTAAQTFLGGLSHESTVPSTVPANGDVNPYGVARVPVARGKLVAGASRVRLQSRC